MKICYCSPAVSPCGGIRVLFEHTNRLQARGHEVAIISPIIAPPSWFDLRVPLISWREALKTAWDVVVASSPETLDTAIKIPAKSKVYFVQMMEHLFFHPGSDEYELARDSYPKALSHGFYFLTIAEWLQRELTKWGRESEMICNGVNKHDFYQSREKENYVLVEGDNRNYAKDVEELGWKAALTLRDMYGVKVYGYSANPNSYMSRMDQFVLKPSTEQMRDLYSGALFTIKASQFEGRSLAPLESLACGTPVVRAISFGDDDIQTGTNGIRTPYNFQELTRACVEMLTDVNYRHELTKGAIDYSCEFLNWEPIIWQVEDFYQRAL